MAIAKTNRGKNCGTNTPDLFKELINPALGLDVRLPGAETDREHIARVADFTKRIIEQHPDNAKILIFSHGGSIKGAAAHLCDMNTESMWRLKTTNSGISTLVYDVSWRGPMWQIMGWNDTYHLNHLD